MGAPGLTSLALRAGERFDYGDVILVAQPPRTPDDPRVWAETVFSAASLPFAVRALFGVRMALAPLLGLRPAPKGVFDVRQVVGQEALMAFDDAHLEFRCAVAVDPVMRVVRMTTIVRLHNWRGRLYFAPVGILHPWIVHAMLRRCRRVLAARAAR
ncbi:DUF2867 domain-containing protein [Microbacterium sp. JZ31]|uniref:DUF2867 domain-containing protein n=1 Tax=Microbacterium sp. JZ31 TaxID=1906274 RepID=UPI001EE41893|nr:DUF2867 domain-containing protein [Microbacterium sp. JZ31]